MSARPFGNTPQTCGSCSPMRWATARMVTSAGPISAAVAMKVRAMSRRHRTGGGHPSLRAVGTKAATATRGCMMVICGAPHGSS